MAEKDIREKTLLGYNEIFADVVNTLLFHGEERIKPEDLEDREGRSQYKFAGSARDQERDVLKQWKLENIQIALIGLENQTEPDALMPVRIIGYDGASYRKQLNNKVRNVQPVITMVLYFGYKTRWNTAKRLSEKVRLPQGLKRYFQDYAINVFEVAWLPDEVIDSFRSDFWVLADFLRQMRKTGDYHPKESDKSFRRIPEMLQLLASIRHDDRYMDKEVIEYFTEKGEARMDQLIDKWLAEGRLEGEAKGRLEGEAKGRLEGEAKGRAESIRSLMANLHLGLEEAMNVLSIKEEDKPGFRDMIAALK